MILKEGSDGVQEVAGPCEFAVEGFDLQLLVKHDGEEEGALEIYVREPVERRAVFAGDETDSVEGRLGRLAFELVPEAGVAGLETLHHRRDGVRRVAHEDGFKPT